MISITKQELISILDNRAEKLITKVVKEEHPEKTKHFYNGKIDTYYEIVEMLEEIIIEEEI